MRWHNQSTRADRLLRILIHLKGLLLYGLVSHKRGSNLLVTISTELLLIGNHRVELSIKSSLNLQFVINKKVHIFFNGLLVNHAFRIVLVIRILELRTLNGMACNCHNHRVVCLCKSHAPVKEHGHRYYCLFHLKTNHYLK